MGSKSKIKKVHLSLNNNNESTFLGVVSAEPDYKLSLSLNKHLNISLKNTIPVTINDESGKEIIFSRFSHSAHAPFLIYDLISNRSGKNVLFKKFKNIDYIFLVHDTQNETDINNIATAIRATEFVSAVFNLNKDLIRDKNISHLLIH